MRQPPKERRHSCRRRHSARSAQFPSAPRCPFAVHSLLCLRCTAIARTRYRCYHHLSNPGGIAQNIRFPTSDHLPASHRKLGRDPFVSRTIREDLSDPILGIMTFLQSLHSRCQCAAVPKVAVAKHGYFGRGEDEIRSPRQTSCSQSIPHSPLPELPSQQDLASRVGLPAAGSRSSLGSFIGRFQPFVCGNLRRGVRDDPRRSSRRYRGVSHSSCRFNKASR